MSRRYSPDHKMLVLRLLAVNKGDAIRVSHFTGIPVRTIRDWELQQRRAEAYRKAVMSPLSSRRQL